MLHSSIVRCRAESESILHSGRKALGARDVEAGRARDFSLLDYGIREPHGWARAISGRGDSFSKGGNLRELRVEKRKEG